jgi:hypothetical protein
VSFEKALTCIGSASGRACTRNESSHTKCLSHTRTRTHTHPGTTALQPKAVPDRADWQAGDGEAQVGHGVQGRAPFVRLVHEPSGEHSTTHDETAQTVQRRRQCGDRSGDVGVCVGGRVGDADRRAVTRAIKAHADHTLMRQHTFARVHALVCTFVVVSLAPQIVVSFTHWELIVLSSSSPSLVPVTRAARQHGGVH